MASSSFALWYGWRPTDKQTITVLGEATTGPKWF